MKIGGDASLAQLSPSSAGLYVVEGNRSKRVRQLSQSWRGRGPAHRAEACGLDVKWKLRTLLDDDRDNHGPVAEIGEKRRLGGESGREMIQVTSNPSIFRNPLHRPLRLPAFYFLRSVISYLTSIHSFRYHPPYLDLNQRPRPHAGAALPVLPLSLQRRPI